ncbi:MAG: flavodoxin domain-containing protein [Candidatus Omnitrophica bacterium]|nr:flavodoxin domain-containing protein [Candidatus Omnitrophota bacterium]
MKPLELVKGIYWVGAVDWNVRNFHGHTYTTKRGTTYNAYLIVDEKIALVDTVYGPFAGELVERIRAIVSPEKIDYVISNHVETDHSGAMPEIMKLCPKAKVYCTAKGKDGLYKNYYGNWDFVTVKTGDVLKLGRRSLKFIEAPMIHWPDSMFTYCPEEAILMPNDAFGQHIATSGRFDDEVDSCALMDEASAYYANILWPLGGIISRKLDEVLKMNLPIKIIAPSHGIIWRKDPMKIVNAYASWTKEPTKRKAVIIYETMWKSTEIMAKCIAQGLVDSGVEVGIHDVTEADHTALVQEMFDAKAFLVGSSTHDNDMLPNIAGFLELLKGFKPKGRIAAAFGSYGWAGGAVQEIEKVLKECGTPLAQDSISVKYVPDVEERKRCYQFGVDLARKL